MFWTPKDSAVFAKPFRDRLFALLCCVSVKGYPRSKDVVQLIANQMLLVPNKHVDEF